MEQKSNSDGIPNWVCEPKLNTCYLKVERDGQILPKIRAISKKRWTVFGRLKSDCDELLLHASISRQHAAVAHGQSGNLYVVDLSSSHGTFVNGRRLQPSKRQVLKDGDKLKFGASSRLYSVRLADPHLVNRNASTVKEALEGEEVGVDKEEKVEVEKNLSRPKNERIRCRHILVKHQQSRRPKSWRGGEITLSREDAMAKTTKMRKELEKNIDSFAVTAEKESDCSSYKTGGDLGFFSRGRMQQPFEDGAFKLSKGEISDVVETNSGFHLILRTE